MMKYSIVAVAFAIISIGCFLANAEETKIHSNELVKVVCDDEKFEPIYKAPTAAILIGNCPVPVYEQPVADKEHESPIDFIQVNFGMPPCNLPDEDKYDLFYIVADSPLRFKIVYQHDSDNSDYQYGWVDKRYIGINAQNGKYTKIFAEPSVSENYEEIFVDHNESKIFTLLEIRDDGFRKVMFNYKGKLYYGWVNQYRIDPLH